VQQCNVANYVTSIHVETFVDGITRWSKYTVYKQPWYKRLLRFLHFNSVPIHIKYTSNMATCYDNNITAAHGLWSKRRQVKTAINPNNTYSSSDAYIIDRRLYTYMACNC